MPFSPSGIRAAKDHPEVHSNIERAREARDRLKLLDLFDRTKQNLEEIDKQRDPRVHWQDCADPGSCSDSCTSLGRQIATANTCLKGLLGTFSRVLGRPLRGDVPPVRPRGPVERPNPDGPLGPEAGADICLIGSDPPTTNKACGLQLCADGVLSAISREGCICGGQATAWKPLSRSCMRTIRCQPGQMPDENCQCPRADTTEPTTSPPRPLPVWLGVDAGNLGTIPVRRRERIVADQPPRVPPF